MSLQNISKSVALTQNNLSTGLKVNSAIDNPSSYYTAKSLTNRANDLNALLDSMGQAVSAIKAATQGIESASMMLEQMRAVTEQAITEAQYIPHKVEIKFDIDVEKLVNEQNYIAVDSLAALQAEIAKTGAKIVLTKDIDCNGSLNISGADVTINGGGHTLSANRITFSGANGTIENVKIENTAGTNDNTARAIYNSKNSPLTVRNVEINMQNTLYRPYVIESSGFVNIENVKINLSGNIQQGAGVYASGGGDIKNVSIDINSSNDTAILAGIISNNSNTTVQDIAVRSNHGQAYGLIGATSNTDLGRVSMGTSDSPPSSIYDGKGNTQALLSYYGNAASTKAIAATAATQYYADTLTQDDDKFGQNKWYLPSIGELVEMYGVNDSQVDWGYGNSGVTSGEDSNNKVIKDAMNYLATPDIGIADALPRGYLWSSSEAPSNNVWMLSTSNGTRSNLPKDHTQYVRSFLHLENCFNSSTSSKPEVGQVLYYKKNGGDIIWGDAKKHTSVSTDYAAVGIITEVNDDGSVKLIGLKNAKHNGVAGIRWSSDRQDIPNIENVLDLKLLQAMNPNTQVVSIEEVNRAFADLDAGNYEARYNEALGQYDAVLNDAEYKGGNLLKNDKLEVQFNETGNNSSVVQGKNLSSDNLGISLADWAQKEGLLQSVRELTAAVATLRSFSSELGNSYSIVTTRQEFTENLINILTEGADKLTLADMNEKSANMLALQTRQQLAVNALSLANQSAQSVLKLF